MGLIVADYRKAGNICNKEYKTAKQKYKQPRTIFQIIFGYCPCCERYFRACVKTQRRASAYCEESDNWLTACKVCHEQDDAYFDDLWDQFYSGLL